MKKTNGVYETVEWVKFFMSVTTIAAPWLFLCMLVPEQFVPISLGYWGIVGFILFPTIGYFFLIIFVILPFLWDLLIALGGG